MIEEWIKVIAPLIGIAGLWWKLTTSMATKSELSVLKADFKADIAEVKADVKSMKADLKGDISELRADIREIRQLVYKIFTESEKQE